MPSREGPTVVRNGTHGLVKKGARNQLFPFSNDVGARAPGAHIGRVLEMAEEPADKYAYEKQACRAIRRSKRRLERVVPTPSVIPASAMDRSGPLRIA
jgi:hypothetical protein